jgi:hypothetical protein
MIACIRKGFVAYHGPDHTLTPAEQRLATYLKMTTWKTLTRLALNRVLLSSAMAESVLAHLRGSIMREHGLSLACVEGGCKVSPGSEAVFIESLESSVKSYAADEVFSWGNESLYIRN